MTRATSWPTCGAPRRCSLTRAVELLNGTDWHRSDALAAESPWLEAMRE
jgi:hypothetical protein